MRSRGEVMFSALNKKLVREVWQLRGQLFSIAAVVAVGIMTVLTMRGTYESLVRSRDLYYAESRFPHIWSQLKRAPESLRRRIETIPGVAAVDTRVTFTATLDVAGLDVPALGRFVSVPDAQRPKLANLHLKSGRYVAPGRRDEVVISENFALANRLRPGDSLAAVINGALRQLHIVGTAISPEHVYAVPPGALYPEDERYGILWMSCQVLGPAYDMDGAFNEVVLTLAPGANADQVMAAVDRILEPYGGLGAFRREDQPSHAILDGELKGNRTTGTIIPAVFLAVAAFLMNIVLGRMIATQRTEIAVLKAFGYSDQEVGRHYMRFAMVAVMGGAVVGIGSGIWLGRGMVAMYGDFFNFPTLQYTLQWRLVAIAVAVSAVAAATGAMGAVRRATALPAAEAMRPEPPASFKPGPLERIGFGRLLPAAGRMILRNVERRPLRAGLSALGVAFAVAILVVGMFMFDGVEYMMTLQFRIAQREDLSLTFNEPRERAVRYDLAHLEGVTRVEPYRSVPVRLRAGHRTQTAAITGLAADAQLRRVVTADGKTAPLPPEGLVMSQYVADQLQVKLGDQLMVEVLEGERRKMPVAVAGIFEDFLGVALYMPIDALHQLARGGRTFSGAYLSVDPESRAALNTHLKRLPAIAGVSSPEQALASFEKQLSEGLFIAIFFIVGFSAIIAVAVIYNGSRIALSERGRELASLRVLGFSRNEVAVLLLGEQALITLAAVPLGWGLGYTLAVAVSAGFQSESYRIPLIVSGQTLFLAATITAAAAVLSGWLVRKRLDRMDLVEVLKTRE